MNLGISFSFSKRNQSNPISQRLNLHAVMTIAHVSLRNATTTAIREVSTR